ncbi:hypothetical protein OPT61_g4990 [Boeremia exigua]|uniref:Uncharacterized protein n=1 Tax=Boeremia exigua TaxID=749465 RepID=A0ACC2IBW7_9PLEO|nr:hypothetical protein OPT61_g4990 [Boeremia exigua]
MPPAKSSKSRKKAGRTAPYPASKSADKSADQEPASPKDSASPVVIPPLVSKSKPASDDGSVIEASPDLLVTYLDIELEECFGHWGDLEATQIRRKLNALFSNKVTIPGSNQHFTKASLSRELCKIARSHHPIDSSAGKARSEGPSAHAITNFLKKTGPMGGADSETFYYGTMLLEMLRIWNGEKMTKARKQAEEEFPSGRRRIDPDTAKLIFSRANMPTRAEVCNLPR